ncbi:MAG: DUF1569 domain-containing protein [Gemmatimonadota bacterium]|nr:DUF1569 domain-containing protein [Gemmatimonadota bacterium]
MISIFEPGARETLVRRLATLSADAPARWGKFTATRMLAHVNDGLRMATGELPVKARKSFLRNAVVRYLVIYVFPFPKGAPTAPELLVRGAHPDRVEFNAERTAFADLLATIGSQSDRVTWPDHPAFGPMTRKDWGVLGYKHVHHHFTQFGV